jgi:HPt (histidine-containing phosphotransfer) domain-containing protein
METAVPIVAVDADLADLIPRYLNNRQADLIFAGKLLANRDFWLLAGMAHRIRGSAASYGFDGLGEIAQALGSAADAQDAEGVEACLHDYEVFIRSVRVEYV